MSYDIEFAKVFLKSEEGITPCVLMGCNNVTENRFGHERVARDWSVIWNKPGTTEQEMLGKVPQGVPDCWKKNGKWLDSDAVARWIKSGCRNAVTVEEFIAQNRLVYSLECHVSKWEDNQQETVEIRQSVKTTEELDNWIRAVKQLIENKDPKVTLYPVVNLHTEDPVVRPQSSLPRGKVFVKCRGTYLSRKCTNAPSIWVQNKYEAKIFDSVEDAKAFIGGFTFGAQYLKADELVKYPYNVVIMLQYTKRLVMYVQNITPKGAKIISSLNGAKRYRNEEAANKVVAELSKKHPDMNFQVICLDETD